MNQNTDQDDDLNWLNGLRDEDALLNASQRIGNAFRKRHSRMVQATPASLEELTRLERRLESEGLLKDASRKTRGVGHTLLNLISISQPWLVGLTVAAFSGLLIWKGPAILHTNLGEPQEDLKTFRGFDLKNVTRIYTDLPLSGYQFQIVKDIDKAESEWKAALIEASLSHSTNRSITLPGAAEIHIRLSSGISHLDSDHHLNKAPKHGEWVIYLVPEQP